MFDRLKKPFLTVETGEAYQPIRLTYDLLQKDLFLEKIHNLKCIEKNPTPNSWAWFWRDECDDLHFESLDEFQKKSSIRLGTLALRDNKLFLNLPSFKRACLAVPFFYKILNNQIIRPSVADFINKVFAIDERLPHGFSELFKDEELDQVLQKRIQDYEEVERKCSEAATADEAKAFVMDYLRAEAKKRLPYAERYRFDEIENPDIEFLTFYIYLHGREIVAIKRWMGEAGYSLSDVADETLHDVFGDIGLDIIE